MSAPPSAPAPCVEELDALQVSDCYGGDTVYIDLEDDGNLLLETLQSQFEGAIGLKYPFQQSYRAVRVKNGLFMKPKTGWKDVVHIVVRQDSQQSLPTNDGKSEEPPLLESTAAEMTPPILSEEVLVKETNVVVKEESTSNFLKHSSDLIVQKKELRKYAVTSSTARVILLQWNRLNTAIRHQVYSIKWHGSGGSSRCQGTNKEDAILNTSLRESIIKHQDVKKYFHVYTLEDGKRVVLDEHYAREQVKQCINDMKRGRANNTIFIGHGGKVKSEPDSQDDARGTSTSLEEVDKENGSSVSTTKRKKPRKQDTQRYKHLSRDISTQLMRSELETKRAENIKMNIDKLHELGLHKGVSLLDEDAHIIGLSFFPPTICSKLSPSIVKSMADAAGIHLPKRSRNLRDIITALGHELFNSKRAKILNGKKAGLTRVDISFDI